MISLFSCDVDILSIIPPVKSEEGKLYNLYVIPLWVDSLFPINPRLKEQLHGAGLLEEYDNKVLNTKQMKQQIR